MITEASKSAVKKQLNVLVKNTGLKLKPDSLDKMVDVVMKTDKDELVMNLDVFDKGDVKQMKQFLKSKPMRHLVQDGAPSRVDALINERLLTT